MQCAQARAVPNVPREITEPTGTFSLKNTLTTFGVRNLTLRNEKAKLSTVSFPLPLLAFRGDTQATPPSSSIMRARSGFALFSWVIGITVVCGGGAGLMIAMEELLANRSGILAYSTPDVTGEIDAFTWPLLIQSNCFHH